MVKHGEMVGVDVVNVSNIPVNRGLMIMIMIKGFQEHHGELIVDGWLWLILIFLEFYGSFRNF